jgi:hypothetical protein
MPPRLRWLRLFCLALAPLALAACKSEKKKEGEAGTAQGEILPGSASDAMLPLDSVRSQPPLAPEQTPSGKPAKASGKHAGEQEEPLPGATQESGPPSPGAPPSIAADPAAME